jgi:NodT family efflux transporter outer membrane factor (OMF) lipoprotein
MPDVWHQELARGLQDGEANLASWWTALGDPQLDGLIERAKTGNLDLRQSVARILEARAQRGIAVSDRFPEADGVGTVQRDRTSEELLADVPPGRSRTDTFYGVGADTFWELDLWGRITRSIESADSSLEGSVEDYRDVLVSLYSEVANTYTEVRALQARIRYALGNVETQRGSLRLTVDRRDAGIGSDLDVSQAELNLASTEAFVPVLRSQLAAAVHALGVLVGGHPSALWTELSDEVPIPKPPPQIVVGLPTELLRQRPDIRRAERELAAQTALIGVATAELYPSFSLVGTFTFEAFDSSDLLERSSRTYGFGPSFRWNLFDGGRVRQAIQVEDARTNQALARYEQTVLSALEDVEDAMVAYVQESARRDALERSAVAGEKAVELVNVLYRTGLTDFQNVLDTERSLFVQQDQLAESEGLVTQNLIEIYRALGGGWSLTTN